MARLITAGQATLLAALLPWSGSAVAQPVTSAPTASASEEDPAPPAPVVLAFPGMTGPLTLNPDPTAIDAGPLGDLYVTGDDRSRLAIGNAQLFAQDTDGPLQFAVQAGLYSFPSLGGATPLSGLRDRRSDELRDVRARPVLPSARAPTRKHWPHTCHRPAGQPRPRQSIDAASPPHALRQYIANHPDRGNIGFDLASASQQLQPLMPDPIDRHDLADCRLAASKRASVVSRRPSTE